MSKQKFVYQFAGRIYSSRIKAHNALCEAFGKNPDKFLPTKEALSDIGSMHSIITYGNGSTILKLILNPKYKRNGKV